jgi:hypothetical protein
VQPYRKHLFLGKTGSGKSCKAMELLYQLRNDLDEVYVFVGSLEGKEFWGRCVPQAFIFPGFKESKFKKIMERQIGVREDFREGKINKPSRVMVIFEDLSFLGKELTKNPYLKMFFYQGRHFYMDGIIVMQYCKDYVYCTNLKTREVRVKIWELWMGCVTFEEFVMLLQLYTSHHRMLVFDNLTQDGDLLGTFYWFHVSASQMEVHKNGFTVGNVHYLYNASIIDEKQRQIMKHCNISTDELKRYRRQRIMEDMISLTQFEGGSGAAKRRGRGRGH